jgi:hypothetical protein
MQRLVGFTTDREFTCTYWHRCHPAPKVEYSIVDKDYNDVR